MSAGKQAANWRVSTNNGRAVARQVDTPTSFNGTLQPALLGDGRMSAAAKSSAAAAAADLRYDAHGAAVYVCAVISVYALFVVVFVAILFAVRRRRRHHPKSRHGAAAEADAARRPHSSYMVKTAGVLHDISVRIPPPPPPPQSTRLLYDWNSSARLRSDSSSSGSPVRRSSRGRRGRSAGGRGRCRVDELEASPRGRSANNSQSRRAVSASPIDDFITLIQVTDVYMTTVVSLIAVCHYRTHCRQFLTFGFNRLSRRILKCSLAI